jgi:holliday junction DNA helicase RuvA
MIGKLTGRIDYRAEDHLLIDVAGVGYLVYCSDRTLAALPGPGNVVALYTDLVVREDLMQLYGFPTLLEKEWHRLLMGVQGVGAKAALAILGALGAEGVSRAIMLGDMNAIKAAKGIGPKTAQRVVIELKDKAPAVMAMGGTLAAAMGTVPAVAAGEVLDTTPAPRKQAAPARPSGSAAAQSDALSALVNLGYSPGDAAGAVARAAADAPEAEAAALIRAALKSLAPKG